MQAETSELLGRVVRGLTNIATMVRDDTNAVVATQDHVAIIKHYDEVRKAMDEVKLAREALDFIKDQLSKEYVPDVLRAMKVKTITLEGIGRVTISNRFSASMTDKDAGMKWLEDNGHGGLITMTVNSSSLSAFAKEMLEDKGTELPPEIFKVSTQAFTSITKK